MCAYTLNSRLKNCFTRDLKFLGNDTPEKKGDHVSILAKSCFDDDEKKKKERKGKKRRGKKSEHVDHEEEKIINIPIREGNTS